MDMYRSTFTKYEKRDKLADLLEYSLRKNNVLSEEKCFTEIKRVIKQRKKLDSKTFNEYSRLLNVSSSDYYYFTENNYLVKFVEAIFEEDIDKFTKLLDEGKKYNDIKYKLVFVYYCILTGEDEKAIKKFSQLYEKLDLMNHDELNIFQYIIIYYKYQCRQLNEAYDIIQFFKKRITHNSKLNAMFYYVAHQVCFDLGLHNESNHYLEHAINIATEYYNIGFLSQLNLCKILILVSNNECHFAQDIYDKYQKFFNLDQLKYLDLILDKNILCTCIEDINEIKTSELRNKLVFNVIHQCVSKLYDNEYYLLKEYLDESLLLEEDILKLNFYDLIIKKDYENLEKYYTKQIIPLFLRNNFLLELHWLNKKFLDVMVNNYAYKSIFKIYSKTLIEIEQRKSRLRN